MSETIPFWGVLMTKEDGSTEMALDLCSDRLYTGTKVQAEWTADNRIRIGLATKAEVVQLAVVKGEADGTAH